MRVSVHKTGYIDKKNSRSFGFLSFSTCLKNLIESNWIHSTAPSSEIITICINTDMSLKPTTTKSLRSSSSLYYNNNLSFHRNLVSNKFMRVKFPPCRDVDEISVSSVLALRQSSKCQLRYLFTVADLYRLV